MGPNRYMPGGNCGCDDTVPVDPGVQLPTCYCKVPTTVKMYSADPNANYKMFQNCDLKYGPAPQDLQSCGYTDSRYYSTQSFVDPITGSTFWYYLWCQYNQFRLTRIYKDFPGAAPGGGGRGCFQDSILYSWIVNGPGAANACSPFQLLCGTPFQGSDASARVGIAGQPCLCTKDRVHCD